MISVRWTLAGLAVFGCGGTGCSQSAPTLPYLLRVTAELDTTPAEVSLGFLVQIQAAIFDGAFAQGWVEVTSVGGELQFPDRSERGVRGCAPVPVGGRPISDVPRVPVLAYPSGPTSRVFVTLWGAEMPTVGGEAGEEAHETVTGTSDLSQSEGTGAGADGEAESSTSGTPAPTVEARCGGLPEGGRILDVVALRVPLEAVVSGPEMDPPTTHATGETESPTTSSTTAEPTGEGTGTGEETDSRSTGTSGAPTGEATAFETDATETEATGTGDAETESGTGATEGSSGAGGGSGSTGGAP